MSHPIPSHNRNNEYPSDNYKPVQDKHKGESSVSKLKRLVGESQQIRKGNLTGKKKVMANKMRLKKHASFVKKNPNKHSPYVKYDDFND